MKFVSWNVNGIRACVKKGFVDVFQELDADVFCIQEQQYLQKKNRLVYLMALGLRSMTRKAE